VLALTISRRLPVRITAGSTAQGCAGPGSPGDGSHDRASHAHQVGWH
jgi:hypothetical protein